MRLASFALCFGGTTALAATVQSINANVEKGTHGHTAGADITIFDGMRVPKLRELTSDNAESALNRTKYMVVNYGTPYCRHCIDFIPTYQTVYEYYYTSAIPINRDESPSAPATTLEEYYGLEFSTVNCLASSDICVKYAINSYPRTVLYKNGEIIGTVIGAKKMNIVADMIENALEAEHPGTRPLHPLLPAPGANSRPVPEGMPQDKVPTDESQKPLNAVEPSV